MLAAAFEYILDSMQQAVKSGEAERRLALAEVLNWLAQGKSNRDIGAILSLSPRTVNKHLEQIYVKLEVENRTAAAVLAIVLHLLRRDVAPEVPFTAVRLLRVTGALCADERR